MHEFSVARSICRIALEEAHRAGGGRVTVVRLDIGVMRQIVPQLLTTAFSAVSKGTVLEGASLETQTIPVTVECRQCGQIAQCDHLQMQCLFCGSGDVHLSGGDELRINSISLTEEVDREYHRAS